MNKRVGINIANMIFFTADRDPRLLEATVTGRQVEAFVWRNVVYYRDDTDTTTADSIGMGTMEGVTSVECIVTQDGWRFKPVDQRTHYVT